MPGKIKPAVPHYFVVYSPGPHTIVRVPMAEFPARRSVGGVTWRVFLKGLTPVLHSYGLRAKDVTTVGNLFDCETEKAYRAALPRIEAAFAGSRDVYRSFKLWDWKDGRFVLVRDAVENDDAPQRRDGRGARGTRRGPSGQPARVESVRGR